MRSLRNVLLVFLTLMTLSSIITYRCCNLFTSLDSNGRERLLNNIDSRKPASLYDIFKNRRLSEAADAARVQHRLTQLEKKLFNMSDLQYIRHQTDQSLHRLQQGLYHQQHRLVNGLNEQNTINISPDKGTNNVENCSKGTNNVENCSKDPDDKPYLSCITTDPPLTLNPSFTSLNTVYEAVVEYDIYVISVHLTPSSCYCEAKPEDTGVTSRTFNYTLGLGINVLKLAVIDVSQREPVKLNTYTFHIIRQKLVESLPNSHSIYKLHTCVLKQDCNMIYSEYDKCGLQSHSEFITWESYLRYVDGLPECNTSDVAGLWYVPCGTCEDNKSCDWNNSVWQNTFCKHRKISDRDIQKCFTGKRLLFIGDSTNRGILHYILERINGTLMSWDKTHNFRRYLNINNNKTITSFAYYPQFWLPTNHRPSFDKAIYQLIKWTLPLENNSNTVFVVGGVQWLDKHHLKLVMKALQRENLTGIKLIMKGLGAGFHENVDGVMYVPMDEQRKHLAHEADLGQHGRKLGFKFIPTFNMTMARYSEFYPGQCACHFHKVLRKEDSEKEEYHVEGHINSIYSELVINEICKPRPPD